MKIIWSDDAAVDMDDIYDFYLLKNFKTANKIYNSILKEVEKLKTNPRIAAVEPLIQNEEFIFRSLVTKDGLFKIIYFVDDKNIFIYRVWYCRADPGRLM